MVKIIFIDVDNTLTSPITHEIPESAKKAVALARQGGVKVFAATGRNTLVEEEARILSGMDFDGYIALNGQYCYLADGTVLRKTPMDAAEVEAIVGLAKKLGHSCLCAALYHTYITAMNDRVLDFQNIIKLVPPPVKEFDSSEEIYSISPYINIEEEELYRQVAKGCAVTRWNSINCDFMPVSGGKHLGVLAALDHYGLTTSDAMVLGDGGNDITMLEIAGVSLAMNHSLPQVKAAAKDVALPVDDDGIYKAFVKYGVIHDRENIL